MAEQGRPPAWLVAHHDRWATDRPVIDAALGAVGCHDATLRRLVVGQANEVYEASSGGARFVVRIAHRPDHRLWVEAAVTERVRALGVPAPRVLHVEELDPDTGAAAIMVEEWLPGLMLHEAAAAVSRPEAARLGGQLGEILAVVHAVEVAGFGNLDEQLRGAVADYPAWFVDLLVDRDVPVARSELAGDAEGCALVERAGEVVSAHREVLARAVSRLAHGDVGPTNVLVDGGRVSGFVDWEAVKGAPPANDFGWWDANFDDGPVKAADLLAGYRSVTGVDDDFDMVRRLVVLRVSVSLITHHARVGNTDGVAAALDRLEHALARAR